jgi:hypothetical protein
MYVYLPTRQTLHCSPSYIFSDIHTTKIVLTPFPLWLGSGYMLCSHRQSLLVDSYDRPLIQPGPSGSNAHLSCFNVQTTAPVLTVSILVENLPRFL